MSSQLLTLATLAIGAIVVGLLMFADRQGWPSPLPALNLDRRWISVFWLLLIAATTLQALRLTGVL